MITYTPTSSDLQLSAFAKDVLLGLTQQPRKLPSKYFYDHKGDALFQEIMHMPEYYLMNCELEIFNQHKAAILAALEVPTFNLIELGAGDGYKTKVLLEHFISQGISFEYQPIDISRNVLQQLEDDLHQSWPDLPVRSLHGDYFEMLHQLSSESTKTDIVMFLGANIGNYQPDAALQFLCQIRENLNPGDYLLIGVDLKKDPATILNAYNDPAGITAAFNLNLLTRMNRELGANFEVNQFKHWETYNPVTGAAKSFIISTQEQEVHIKALQQSFHFQAWEAIDVELSQKYSLSEVESTGCGVGLSDDQTFYRWPAVFCR
jgi:L-histidine N-alpha-methyltransferase